MPNFVYLEKCRRNNKLSIFTGYIAMHTKKEEGMAQSLLYFPTNSTWFGNNFEKDFPRKYKTLPIFPM